MPRLCWSSVSSAPPWTSYTRAITLYKETGDRYGEGSALHGLGLTLRKDGRLGEARERWQEAVDAYTASDAAKEAAQERALLDEL